jgi:hypothetical protein
MTNKTQISTRRDRAGIPAVALALLVLGAVPALAVPQINSSYGDQMAWSGAEINAMGGTGTAVYRGGLSNLFNPSLLTDEQGYRFDVGGMLDQEHEDRFQPLFDTFDSWVVDAAIASNRHHYWQTGFAASGRFFRGTTRPVVLSLSLADRYPYSYVFDEELLNPSPFPPAQGEPARDLLIEERRREIGGSLRTLSLGGATEVHERLSVGAAVHYAFGTRTELNTVRDHVPADGDDSYRTEDELKLDGVNFTVGVRGVVNERIEIGLAWESRLIAAGDLTSVNMDADGWTQTTESAFVRYPQMFRAGFVFRPRTDPRTVFTIEAEYKPWSELEDSAVPGDDNPGNLRDVTDVRVGLDHTFYNGMPLRFGFRHFDSYADRDASIGVFSSGVGAPVAGGMMSVSVELSKATSVQGHQFPYPTDFFGDNFHDDPIARVEDTRFRVGVGYKVEF